LIIPSGGEEEEKEEEEKEMGKVCKQGLVRMNYSCPSP
jgi:hypothetical protein